jgi:hypothetical protein
LALLAALALLITGVLASTASAAVTETNITSPGNPTYTLDERGGTVETFSIKGTANENANVDINCYSPSTYVTVAADVTVSGDAFSATGSAQSLDEGPCVLRAVPTGDTTAYPPGVSSTFTGPQMARSYFETYVDSNSKATYGYEFEQNTLTAYNEIEDAGDCGLDYSNLYAPGSLEASEGFFYCNGALFERDLSSSRSDIQIDGQNAYDSSAADNLYEELKMSSAPAPISINKTFNTGSGEVTIHETDPIVKCASSKTNPNTFPPTEESCQSLVSAGVQLERTWQISHAGQVIDMTDTWHSTDGASHSLNALYFQEFVSNKTDGSSFEFPGHSEFGGVEDNEKVSLPSGSGTILYKEDKNTPSSGNLEHPQGAIVYDNAPSEAIAFGEGTGAGNTATAFEMPYQRTIPAGGSYTLRMGFVQAYSLAEVNSLAEGVKSTYTPPSVSITSPANGATVSTASVTVSGTAKDNGGIESLTVDGQTVSVGSNGEWSTVVALALGANTITAKATNDSGQSTSTSIAVTYTPPPPPPPPAAKVKQLGSVSGANGKVALSLACEGTAGETCKVQIALTTIEKLRGHKIIAVSARSKTRSQTLKVAAVTLIIKAGQRVTVSITPNAVGRQLLSKFGKLPVHLTAVLVNGAAKTTIVAQNLTIKPKPKKKKKHHH